MRFFSVLCPAWQNKTFHFIFYGHAYWIMYSDSFGFLLICSRFHPDTLIFHPDLLWPSIKNLRHKNDKGKNRYYITNIKHFTSPVFLSPISTISSNNSSDISLNFTYNNTGIIKCQDNLESTFQKISTIIVAIHNGMWYSKIKMLA